MDNLNYSMDYNFIRQDSKVCKLPKFIMGSDAFVDFCPRDPVPFYMLSENYAYSVFSAAYDYGVRGFDFSWRKQVISAISKLRMKKNDICCFANINWRCGLMLNGIDIIDFKERFLKTICERYFSEKENNYIASLPEEIRKAWFNYNLKTNDISNKEITRIYLDRNKYKNRLKAITPIAEYCLVGTDIVDWIVVLNRLDLLEEMIELIVSYKLLPIAITHWPSITLPILSKYPFYSYFCLLNPKVV